MSQHSSKGSEWATLRKAVLDRDGWTCTYCGQDLVGADATVDHLAPKVSGGTDTYANLVACCRRCNSRKNDSTVRRMPYRDSYWD